jgi:superfamily II DNA or RNA helicase
VIPGIELRLLLKFFDRGGGVLYRGIFFIKLFEARKEFTLMEQDIVQIGLTIDLGESTMDNKEPHPHQREAIESLDQYFRLGESAAQNGLLIMPTGSGKTFTAVAWLLESAVAKGYKVLWLVHRQELVGQAYKTFREQSPVLGRHGKKTLRVMPVSSSPEHYSMSQASECDIYVCGIGSVASKNGMRHIRRMLLEARGKKI